MPQNDSYITQTRYTNMARPPGHDPENQISQSRVKLYSIDYTYINRLHSFLFFGKRMKVVSPLSLQMMPG